ncbi:MAG: hypothetical protein KAU31_16470, partial [Spirochaetaceae bacterium]|nr:hypothetical protein [Spirochaetaceae bacterium]
SSAASFAAQPDRGGFSMMNGFGMSFGLLWWIIPIVALVIGAPLLRRLVGHRDDDRRIEQDQPTPADSITDATIYRLAKLLKGRLTVSDVVVETGMGSTDAEKLLQAMTDGWRVRMEVSPDGMVVYEFAELRTASPSG